MWVYVRANVGVCVCVCVGGGLGERWVGVWVSGGVCVGRG